jgi:Raf kinase inhibitor-like YbhB/YbcL family protein
MTITSTAIRPDGSLLPDYTCDGAGSSPPLTFSEVPATAKSLALIVDDPDAPGGTFTHWLLYDMSPATLQIPENGLPLTGKVGTNDFGQLGYGGPCPPAGEHRYVFKLYALDNLPALPEGATRADLDQAIEGHIIDSTETTTTYQKTTP